MDQVLSSDQPVILDVDPGIDDALAIMLAFRLDPLRVIGVTTVAGNVSIDLTTENALRMLAAVDRASVPVFRGMSAPLNRAFRDAAAFHGDDGLGGVELPASPARVEEVTAPEFIVRSARQLQGQLTLVCVGPLTNLAVALGLEPNLPGLLRRVVVMGGAFLEPGNVTPHAEFNIWVDLEAAAAVVDSELPLTFVGLDVTHRVLFPVERWLRLADVAGGNARLIRELLRRNLVERNDPGFPLHDPLAVAVSAYPDLVRTERWSVAVQTGLSEKAGQTMLVRSATGPKHEVALDVRADEFLALFGERLGLP